MNISSSDMKLVWGNSAEADFKTTDRTNPFRPIIRRADLDTLVEYQFDGVVCLEDETWIPRKCPWDENEIMESSLLARLMEWYECNGTILHTQPFTWEYRDLSSLRASDLLESDLVLLFKTKNNMKKELSDSLLSLDNYLGQGREEAMKSLKNFLLLTDYGFTSGFEGKTCHFGSWDLRIVERWVEFIRSKGYRARIL